MIKLDVADYCQSCPDFEADIEKYVYGYTNDVKAVNTTIRCENSDRCRNMAKYLREKLEGEEHD